MSDAEWGRTGSGKRGRPPRSHLASLEAEASRLRLRDHPGVSLLCVFGHSEAHGGLTCPGFLEDSLDSQDRQPEPRASWALVLSSATECVPPEPQILWEVLVHGVSLAFFTLAGYIFIDSPYPKCQARRGGFEIKTSALCTCFLVHPWCPH